MILYIHLNQKLTCGLEINFNNGKHSIIHSFFCFTITALYSLSLPILEYHYGLNLIQLSIIILLLILRLSQYGPCKSTPFFTSAQDL